VPFVRLHAARAAATFGNEVVADRLAELLSDREWMVRAAARDALHRLNGLGTAAVVRTLWHPDRFAANSAAEVLHRTGAATEAARRVLLHDANTVTHLAAILLRFFTVGGEYLRDAVLDRFREEEKVVLLDRLRGADLSGG
jgi:HEAT repeat protein